MRKDVILPLRKISPNITTQESMHKQASVNIKILQNHTTISQKILKKYKSKSILKNTNQDINLHKNYKAEPHFLHHTSKIDHKTHDYFLTEISCKITLSQLINLLSLRLKRKSQKIKNKKVKVNMSLSILK